MTTDFIVFNHGSVLIFTAATQAALDVLPALGLDGWQQLDARTFAIDHRPAQTLVEQLRDSGYSFGRGNQAQLPFAGTIRRAGGK